MSVVGCVWGAHRSLMEQWGDEFPSYEWCEAEWVRLRKKAPAGNGLADWLRSELFWAWRREQAGERPEHVRQMSLFEA